MGVPWYALNYLWLVTDNRGIDLSSDPQLVLSQARVLDRIPQTERGPLHGVAIGIKDVINTTGTIQDFSLLMLLLTRLRYADPVWLSVVSRTSFKL